MPVTQVQPVLVTCAPIHPAQKWLKDRRGKAKYDDIRHYQRIIAALCETEKIMGD
ncbi:MAG: hypothetical protein LBR06_01665 [Bacteroidales bacterium]|nr:hypothetical protein [Bacteroidales bacterium]